MPGINLYLSSRKVFNFNVNSQCKSEVSKNEETHHNHVAIVYSGRAYFSSSLDATKV